MGVCNCSMFCCMLLYVRSSIAIILMGKRELVALLNLSSWCLVMVERLFLAVPRGSLQFVIVVFPDHTHLLFLIVLLIYMPSVHCLFIVFPGRCENLHRLNQLPHCSINFMNKEHIVALQNSMKTIHYPLN